MTKSIHLYRFLMTDIILPTTSKLLKLLWYQTWHSHFWRVYACIIICGNHLPFAVTNENMRIMAGANYNTDILSFSDPLYVGVYMYT